MSLARARMRTTARMVRDYRGPALFSFGFRPFFLLAAAFSALAVPLWVIAMLGGSGVPGAIDLDWHAHEMLFGYAGAVIVGYLIIAGANWTGHYPVAGTPVIMLASLWSAGRIAMAVAPTDAWAAMVDGAFLILFAGALWREQIAARNGRNLVPSIAVTLLASANVGFHLRHLDPALTQASERLALSVIILLIAVLGGRLVPSFTHNWMAQLKRRSKPAPPDRLDVAAAMVVAAALLSWQLFPSASITGLLLFVAGLSSLARLLRWRGWQCWPEPLVWILHLGYLWLSVGLMLLGISLLAPHSVPYSSGLHALTAGAIGVMTLAMMTRTTLSHTGRGRQADEVTIIIYVLINGAALMRVAAPLWIDAHLELFALSAACWSLAFALFVLVYAPMLATPFQRKGIAPSP